MKLTSLIHPAQAQPDLPLAGASFSDESVIELATSALESRGDHTAAHLFLKNPQLYKAVCFMYASGSAGQLKIASVLKVSVHTVRAIIQRENLARGAAMDTAKTLESMSDLRSMTLETLIEKLSDPEERRKIPFDKLMIGLGIQTEKIELLRGNATERIEHTESAPASDEFKRWLQSGSIDAEVIETGLSGREDGTKGIGDSDVTLALPAANLDDAPAHLDTPGQAITVDQDDADNMDNVGINSGNIGVSVRLSGNDVDCDVNPMARKTQVDGRKGGHTSAQHEPGDETAAPHPAQGGRGSNESASPIRRDE